MSLFKTKELEEYQMLSETVPTSYGDARAAVVIEIDEVLNWWKWELTTEDLGVDYQLSDVIVRFVRVGVIDTN
jgi:hypothetical protein